MGREKVVLQSRVPDDSIRYEDPLVYLPKSTLLAPGIHNGIKFTAEEIEKAKVPKVFPLTLNHSRNVEDEVGFFEDVERAGGKLRAVPVINLETAKGKAALGYVKNRFKAGLIPNLSVEVWVEYDPNDEERIARNLEIIKASLVDIGACSDADGCGVGLQKSNAEDMIEKELVEMGVVPKHPWRYGKDENAAWEKPRLQDFTNKAWDELSDEEKKSIAGHFAWAPENPPERFTDLKLPHHRPKDHAVIWNGVRAAMAALKGARGGVQIPNEDVPRVYAHLAAHYREFDKTPPELKQDENGMWFIAMENEAVEEMGEIEKPAEAVEQSNDMQEVQETQEMGMDSEKEEKEKVELESEITEKATVEVTPCDLAAYEKEIEQLNEKLKIAEATIEKLNAELEKVKAELAEYKEKEKEGVVNEIRKFVPDFEPGEKSVEELKELLEFAKKVAGGKGKRKTLIEPPEEVNAEKMFEEMLRKYLEGGTDE